MDGKAEYIIKKLFKAYLTNPQQLPDQTIVTIINQISPELIDDNQQLIINKSIARDKLKEMFTQRKPELKRVMLRVICDYIAGMTDEYTIRQYEKLYGDKVFKKFI